MWFSYTFGYSFNLLNINKLNMIVSVVFCLWNMNLTHDSFVKFLSTAIRTLDGVFSECLVQFTIYSGW